MSHFQIPRWFLLACVLCVSLRSHLRAEIIINEIVAAASDRLLQFDANGVPQVGTGPRWYQTIFDDALWPTGAGPFGFGNVTAPPTPIATNLQTAIQHLTPTTYFRKSFTVAASDAARADQVQLVVDYNDGFVAFLNGVEVARRNGGPVKKWIYHDQPAYNREVFTNSTPIPTTALSETINLGAASAVLATGGNILAIHLLNASATEATYYLKADLGISGAPAVALVTHSEPWKFFPGVVEPSGNLYDPAQLGSGRQRVPWGTAAYDDAAWSSGAGPLGYGAVGTLGTNVQAQVQNLATSLYQRRVFTAAAGQAADPLALRLVVSYDDGLVAYLNGVEVARRRIGLANTFTPHDATADSDQGSVQTETITLAGADKLLVAGSNVLAIQTHNFSSINGDLLMNAALQTNAGTVLVANNVSWKYFPGLIEPVPEVDGDEEESTPEGPDSNADWIELHNNGASAVSLNGWRLTDEADEPAKWVFPDVSIPPGGYLVVIADGDDVTGNPGGYLHTNFSLDRDGETLALYDAGGVLVSEIAPKYPPQGPFHSYARESGGAWRYSDRATPAAMNAGTFFNGIVATPTVNVPGRFYTSAQSVVLSTTTPGAVVRYTTNGSEPTATSPLAPASLNIATSTALRARSFLTGWVPSETITHTYLIAQSNARKSLPAICLTGDEQRSLYRPFGVFAIQGGGYWSGGVAGPPVTTGFNGVWHYFTGNTAPASTAAGLTPFYPVADVPADRAAYSAPMQSGKPTERPVSFEMLHADATADVRTDSFLRCAGSPYSRNRYTLTNQNSATPNSGSPWAINGENKPQLNVFFRDDLGQSPLKHRLIPGSGLVNYENIRLRAGKNDVRNPFIRDEFARRSFIDMGHVTVLGDFCNVFVNAVFKGYFNICQRPREPFFQEARETNAGFDVRNITAIADGDTLAYNELVSFARTRNMAVPADYAGIQTRLDAVNIADYIVMNAHAAMADWPGNNYVMDRERSASGRWRFSVWDGEGGYGGFGRNPAYKSFNDINASNIATETVPAKLLYTVLKQSPEFRLMCADRIQKHFFNNGALTDARLLARFSTLAARVQPIMTEVISETVSPFLGVWLNGQGDPARYTLSGGTTGNVVNSPSRRTALFVGYTDDTAGGAFVNGFFKAEGIWPATLAPIFNVAGGNVPANFNLTISNPNAGGTIYYTLDGTDPRAPGGAPQGTIYAGAIAINESTRVLARVRSSGGEWSPLNEALFTPPAVSIIISEIMYHPPGDGAIDGDEFEFIELKNTGPIAVDLAEVQFTAGIVFTFQPGASLAPGAFAVLAKNPAQFSTRYPGVPVLGGYGPDTSLSNGGETVTLADLNGAPFFSVAFSDIAPWPTAADGAGKSLVPENANGFTNPNDAAQWRQSRHTLGSPGADDPPLFLPVVINELLANPAAGQSDAVELFNPTTQIADVGSWWLSDSPATPKKYALPAGATIPPGGYLVVTEAQFGASFEFNRTGGEDVVLSSADSDGALTGYVNTMTGFPASPPGVSIGRHLDSAQTPRLALQSALTLGAVNSGPRVGPVVITELMYNYPGRSDFVELRNISDAPVPLFDPANPANAWRLTGLEVTFPAGLILQPRQVVLVYGPTSGNPPAIHMQYNVSTAVQAFASSLGNLNNNGGELVSLQMPAEPVAGQPLAFIEIDAVQYSDAVPWPRGLGSPDGFGFSLERIHWRAYGNDVVNWRTSTANGGNPGALTPTTFTAWRSIHFTSSQLADPAYGSTGADPDGDGLSNFWEFTCGLNPLAADAADAITTELRMEGGAGPFLTMRYRRNLGATGLFLHVDTAPEPGQWVLDASLPVGAPVNNGDGTETLTRRDSHTPTTDEQRFIRLRAVGN